MFQRATAKNLQCFRRLDVELRPLTVAIGENNTGKSTFLKALDAAARAPELRTTGPMFMKPESKGVLALASEGRKPNVASPSVPNVPPHMPRLGPPGTEPLFLTLSSSGPPLVDSGTDDSTGPPAISPHGNGVAALVDWMLRRDRPRFFGFVDAVKALVPGVVDVDIGTPGGQLRSLHLVGEAGWRHSPDGLSAGTRMLMVFLALAWHPSPPSLVLIEEPENGVHPNRLREVMGLLRGLVTGAHAPTPVQVVVTTHSPYVLSCVEVPGDQVLVFRRGSDGACTAQPVDVERIKGYLPEFGLGELWSNLGEAGLVGA